MGYDPDFWSPVSPLPEAGKRRAWMEWSTHHAIPRKRVAPVSLFPPRLPLGPRPTRYRRQSGARPAVLALWLSVGQWPTAAQEPQKQSALRPHGLFISSDR